MSGMDGLEALYPAGNMSREFSLVVVRSLDEGVLLGEKQRGIGNGMLVLPGGKDTLAGYFDPRQTGVDACRELAEETGIEASPSELKASGMLQVEGEDGEARIIEIFTLELFGRFALRESDELTDLAFYPEDSLPYDRMPADYALWLPLVLEGKRVFVSVNGDDQRASYVGQRLNAILE